MDDSGTFATLIPSPTSLSTARYIQRDIKDSVAPACKKQLFKVQMDAAEDFRSDTQLYEACKDDATKLCKDVKMGGGRVQACLVSVLVKVVGENDMVCVGWRRPTIPSYLTHADAIPGPLSVKSACS